MNSRKKVNIIVVGAGMYVCGKGSNGYGTIMPAILEWKKTHDVEAIYMIGRSSKSTNTAKVKIGELGSTMGLKPTVNYFSRGRADAESYKRIFRDVGKPACVIVAVPDRLHKDVASSAIENGLHTLVVKPLTPTVKEALDLIQLQAHAGNTYCAVEFHKRLDLANMKLRDAMESGRIGDPLYFLVEYSQRKSMPEKMFRKWVTETNIFQYLGVHYVDIIYFATGACPVRVMATGQKKWLRSRGIDTYDAIQAVIEWKKPGKENFVSHILTNWIDPEKTSAMSDQKIKVIGTKGRFESDQKDRGIRIVTDDGIEEPNPYFSAPYGREGEMVYRGYGIKSICQFLNDAMDVDSGKVGIDELERTRPTFRRSLIPVAVIEAVSKSLKAGGRWVDIGNICKDVK